MPINRGKDKRGPFYRFGRSGKKYHYTPGNKRSRATAKSKAKRQAKAIKARSRR